MYATIYEQFVQLICPYICLPKFLLPYVGTYSEVQVRGNLADQLSLFKPGWAEYAPHTTAIPLGFKKLSTFMVMVSNVVLFVHSKRVVCMNFYYGVITITIIISIHRILGTSLGFSYCCCRLFQFNTESELTKSSHNTKTFRCTPDQLVP